VSLAHHAVGSTSAEPVASGDDGDTREFPCEQCGANLTFAIGEQRLKCPYCGHDKELALPDDRDIEEQDFHAALAALSRRATERGTAVADKEVTCDDCGGSVLFTDNLTSTSCTYCGAPIQRENVHDAPSRIPPDGVLPFMVERQRAKASVRDWVKSRWFAPNAFKAQGAHGRFDGVYLPYWTYDAMTFSRYRGERGEHYYVTETDSQGNEKRVRKTRWYPASGSFSRFFDDVLIAASKRMPQGLLEQLEPWPFDRLLPFTTDVMAGYLAQTYEVNLDDGWDRARGQIDTALRREAKRRIGGDEQRVHSVRTRYNGIAFKHLLLPVWLMSYRFKEKTYRVGVNACTGEVIGERPWSALKIALAVVAVAIVVGVVWWLSQNR
jgi:DNA-directed RNA polymerase subunit RPC12/RpoP